MKRRNIDNAQSQKTGALKTAAPKSNWVRFGYPLLLVLSTIVIFVASQVGAYLLVSIGMSFIASGSHQSLSDSIAGQFFYIFIAEALAVWLVVFFLKQRGLKLSSIGLGRRPILNDVSRAVQGFILFFVILLGIGVLLNQLSPEIVDKKQNIGFDNINTGIEQVMAFIALVIIAAIGEEILVRGYLYSGLRRVWNFMPALIVTSLLFGAAHLEFGSAAGLVWAAAIDTLVLSVILVYLREKTGALYTGMMVHMLNNLLAFFVIIK